MQRRDALLLGLTTLTLAACSKNEPAAAAPAATPTAAPATPRAAAPGAQTLYAQASKGSGFTVGQLMAVDPVFVFFDPQCPHCAELWKASQPLLSKLRMVWMPVGFLRGVSEPQGAAILSSKEPAVTMAQHEALLESRQGGLTVAGTIPDAELAKVKANTELLNRLGADSVPFILYRNRRTGEYGTHAGAVPTEQLAEMAGL
jgi:thiol:disulfide interchange protein DsbG